MDDADLSISSHGKNISILSDKELYGLCQEYGGNAKDWLKKFAGLLPEVYKRRLYKRRACASIHEFAKKLAGMNEKTVDKVLNLAARLEDKPILFALLQSGQEGWSKIEKVSFIATPETDAEWASKVEKFSTRVLESNVQTNRKKLAHVSDAEHNNETCKAPSPMKRSLLYFRIGRDIEAKLRLIKQKFEKKRREALSWNEVFGLWLRQGAPEEKNRIVIELCYNCVRDREKVKKPSEVGRYVPVDVGRVLNVKYHRMCAFPNCNLPYEVLHHTRRFALVRNHDPDYIVPLCKKHHQVAHSGLIANEEQSPNNWDIREKPEEGTLKAEIDRKLMGKMR